MTDRANHRRLMKRILRDLRHDYGRREWAGSGPAVDVLVGTILSQNTTNANSSAAYRQLRRRFRSWNGAARAPVAEIERCIRVAGLSRTKAPRIRKILRQIRVEHGKVDLEFLAEWRPRRAYDYLMRFDGVGPKTAHCVLLFAFGMPVFPVDTHIDRIARRLGLLPDGIPWPRAHEVLTPMIAPADRYAMHVLLILHGRRTCRARNPRCQWCSLLDICPHGQAAGKGEE